MNVIKFIPSHNILNTDYLTTKPESIKKHIPLWYKQSESTFFSKKTGQVEDGGLKTCMSFLDTFLTGYCLVTPFDIFVDKNDDGSLNIRWNGPNEYSQFVHERDHDQASKLPRPFGCAPNPLIWKSEWGWKTKRGWSSLCVHPMNRYDLPFVTLNGIIDTDKFFGNGNMPFFIKEDFIGMIPKGTPYMQIIPFQRKSWQSYVDASLTPNITLQGIELREMPDPDKNKSYKKFFWMKKDYR